MSTRDEANREAKQNLKSKNCIYISERKFAYVAWKDMHKIKFKLIVFYVRVILIYIDYFQCTKLGSYKSLS